MTTQTEPTAAAMRAARLVLTRLNGLGLLRPKRKEILALQETASAIDRETGLPELIQALESLCGADSHFWALMEKPPKGWPTKAFKAARSALKKAGEA